MVKFLVKFLGNLLGVDRRVTSPTSNSERNVPLSQPCRSYLRWPTLTLNWLFGDSLSG